jgi:penicillin-binding protein 2
MVSATAALEDEIVDTTFRLTCAGGFQFGNRYFKCEHVHGVMNVITSIEHSCNTFYYQLILKNGLDRWHNYASRFGFGKKTGIDIPEESAGLVPSTQYYDKVFGKGKWTKGFLVSLGIGQGELSVTPIQLAQYAALLANYGKSATPHFLKGYVETKTNKFVETKPHTYDIGISRKTLEIIRRAMYYVVNRAGTATSIKNSEIIIAGKTGTAQNPAGKPHAVFVSFAPYDNPKIAVAVIVENAGFGSVAAAPVARDIIKAYLLKGKKETKPLEIANISKGQESNKIAN